MLEKCCLMRASAQRLQEWKKNVTGEPLCIADGRCLGGGTPEAKGVCIEVTEKPKQNRQYQQKDKI